MNSTALDLNAIEAAALHDGTVPAAQAHALIAEVRLLRQQLAASERGEPVPEKLGPEEAGWASVG
jgi:hypothetical protein